MTLRGAGGRMPAAGRRLPVRALGACLMVIAGAASAVAQPSAPADFWHRDTLTGDWDGQRSALADRGIMFGMTYTGDLQGNTRGGMKQGAVVDSLLAPQIDIDLDKLAGWTGATAHVSAIALAGPGITTGYVGNLLNLSSIQGRPAIRLYNAWLQQNLGGDAWSIRAGLMNTDAEFFTSSTAAVFVDSTFGWPGILAIDLPGGGPAYPLSSPGVRVKWQASANLALMAGVFSGDPTGGDGANNPAVMQPDRTLISFTGGALVMAEAAYTVNQGRDEKGPPPVTLKLGGWYHSSRHFQDQRFDDNGLSLANPASDGMPRNHDGDWGLYGIVDATLHAGLSVFARVAGAPDAQNLASFYADGGVAYKGLLPDRPDDTAGIAIAYARIGNQARSLDLDARRFGMGFLPVRSQEIVLEATYQTQVTPWWTLQPDLQVVFNPGGHVANAAGSLRQDALVAGLRTTVSF